MSGRVLPVGVFVCLLRESLESDPYYGDLWLEGEVSDLSRSAAGHAYFTLRDDDGCLKCVLFRGQALRQAIVPRLGDQLAVHGGLSLYPRTGAVQLQVDLVRPAGLGAQALELEYLRQRLAAEGLFDPLRKRPLPTWPRSIGVVTSAHGAAWHDIQVVIARRFPLAELVLAPTQVQGDGAAGSIADALAAFHRGPPVDVVILARGGGASDDLAAFNDERVVRAVFGCSAPVITGIGHATDRTLAEDAADAVAPTPSAAAEICVPSIVQIAEDVASLEASLRWSMASIGGEALSEASAAGRRLASVNPRSVTSIGSSSVTAATDRLQAAARSLLAAGRAGLGLPSALLTALDPSAVLGRGYAVVHRAQDGKPINTIADATPGTRLVTTLRDGSFPSLVDASPTPTVPSPARAT